MTLLQSFTLLQVLDIASTRLVLDLGAVEVNPIAQWAIDGPGLWTIKVAAVAAAWLAVARGRSWAVDRSRWVFRAVVASNLAQAGWLLWG